MSHPLDLVPCWLPQLRMPGAGVVVRSLKTLTGDFWGGGCRHL